MPDQKPDALDDEFFDATRFPNDVPEPAAVSSTAAAVTPLPVPTVVVRTVPRDPKFTVLLDERLPRQDTVLMQVSVPVDIHQRLKYDSVGSMNHVLMGLVRYALQKLDDEQKTLRIERKAITSKTAGMS